MNEWEGFKGVKWQKNIDVANFIEMNYSEYLGDESFLETSTNRTNKLWKKCENLIKKESISGVLDVETELIAGIDNYDPGYIDRKNEVIFGLQTDEPLRRIINPYGGMSIVKQSLENYGFRMSKDIFEKFNEYRKTSEIGISEVYTLEEKKYIANNLIGGLSNNYSRGKIVGDYRRLALYGADYLIKRKKEDLIKLSDSINNTIIRLREEVCEQINSLEDTIKMASRYDIDIRKPASNAKEAIQWIYFGYLASVKQNNGYINSIGRNTTFIDIYIERDLRRGILNEKEAQELIDQFIIKLRLVRHLRNTDYIKFYNYDANLITESIGGMLDQEKSFVTKTSYRFIHSLNNINSYREPNITILWSDKLPEYFKKYTSSMSIKTRALQFINDELMRKIYESDYAISGSVSCFQIGKQIHLSGGMVNLPKALLYALNGGRDEITGELVMDDIEQIEGEYLDYDEVLKLYSKVLKKLAKTYVEAVNIIHYMHDKYDYESIQMSLCDTIIDRLMTFGIAGLSIVTDSLSAVKYGKVRVKRDENGITTSFDNETDYPHYGNNDGRVDEIAVKIITKFYHEIKKFPLYRSSEPTLSIITNNSNIFFGEKTGATPNGRNSSAPFAIGANPTQGCDISGALASLSSVAKIPYSICLDGITNTFFIEPTTLGPTETQASNLSQILDGYFKQGGNQLDINVIDKQSLIDIKNNPSKNFNYLLRMSGYSVNFGGLSKEQKEEIISNTFHKGL